MRLPCFLRELTITEESILTIFTYKWGKCVKSAGNTFLKALYSKAFHLHLKYTILSAYFKKGFLLGNYSKTLIGWLV